MKKSSPVLLPETRSAAAIADGYARHYAALLSQEEVQSPQWRFLFGQLSAASTLAHVLREGSADRLEIARSQSKEFKP